jgi:hypothetical protein
MLFVIGIIGGIGFTVALVVSSEVFADPAPQGEAKMAHAELRGCRDRLSRRKIAENQKNPLIIWIIGLLFEFFLDKTA